jgi:hypothetical protein
MAEQEPDDEARWAEAQSILQSGPGPERRRRLRRLRVRLRVLLVVLLVPAVAVPFLASEDAGPSDGRGVSSGQEMLGLVLLLGSLMVTGVGAFLLWRAFRGRWVSPLVALRSGQNRELLAQVLGRAPLDPAHLGLARYVAETMLIQRPALSFLFSGGALVWVALAVLDPAWWRLLVGLVLLTLALHSGWRARRNERQARRFLAQHPPGPRSS